MMLRRAQSCDGKSSVCPSVCDVEICFSSLKLHITAKECHLSYGITRHLNHSQTGRYSIYLPLRDGRLSLPRWLVTYWDGLPTHRWSPIQVVTGQCRVALTACWSQVQRPNHYTNHELNGFGTLCQWNSVSPNIGLFLKLKINIK